MITFSNKCFGDEERAPGPRRGLRLLGEGYNCGPGSGKYSEITRLSVYSCPLGDPGGTAQ